MTRFNNENKEVNYPSHLRNFLNLVKGNIINNTMIISESTNNVCHINKEILGPPIQQLEPAIQKQKIMSHPTANMLKKKRLPQLGLDPQRMLNLRRFTR